LSGCTKDWLEYVTFSSFTYNNLLL
jgi:hypothetical protein